MFADHETEEVPTNGGFPHNFAAVVVQIHIRHEDYGPCLTEMEQRIRS
jgi:hypothetical protein